MNGGMTSCKDGNKRAQEELEGKERGLKGEKTNNRIISRSRWESDWLVEERKENVALQTNTISR